jgi:hypothetical protein
LVACGTTPCSLDTQVCCAGAGGARNCIARDGACAGVRRACDGPEDCDGERICCARPEPLGDYRTACLKPGECAQLAGAVVCRSGADCPLARTCAPAAFTTELNVCHR